MEAAVSAILSIFKRTPEGLPHSALQSELANTPPNVLRDAINRLLKDKRIDLAEAADGSLVYKPIEAGKSARLKGLGAEHMLVYQCIEAAGDTGVWTKEMKHKTNLQQPQITKILKDLESRTLVKAVRPVNQPSKKFYMLFDLDAAQEITGGAWYTNGEFDLEFVEVMRTQCLNFIKQEGAPTLDDISAFIHDKGISRVTLKDPDVMQLLSSLEYEGVIERIDGEDGDCFRQALLAIPEASAFTSIPCGVCPVFNECTPDGPISPATCVYYQQWLEF